MAISSEAYEARIQSHRVAAARDLADEIKAIISRNAAKGLLNSGTTLITIAKAAHSAHRTFALALLADLDHANATGAKIKDLRILAEEAVASFGENLLALCQFERIQSRDSAMAAIRVKVETGAAEVQSLMQHHRDGFPVAGVALTASEKSWFSRHPALTKIIEWLILLAIGAGGMWATLKAHN